MTKKPYIGVTDFTSALQVKLVKELFPQNCSHILHVGAMISYKTVNNIPTQAGWEKIWLKEAGLKLLFSEKNVFNVIHYADYDNLTQEKDLLKAIDMCGEGLNGIQLDMLWPNISLLNSIKKFYPNLSIIVQVSHTAITQLAEGKISLFDKLSEYNKTNLADFVLLDYGMGRGTTFDPAKAQELISKTLDVFGPDQIAVAGGLGPQTYGNIS